MNSINQIMKEKYWHLNLRFSTEDAGPVPEIRFKDYDLEIRYIDWQNKKRLLRFINVTVFRQ